MGRWKYLVVFGAVAAVVALASVPLAGQTSKVASGATRTASWTSPRTSWGDPDLQGIWRGRNTVPLEREPRYGNREFLTDQELAAKDKAAADRAARNLRGEAEDRGFRNFRLYNSVWGASGEASRTDRRTAAIVDPPNGRLPAWTSEAVKSWEGREAATRGRGEADTWEDRWYHERCINAFWAPMVPNWGMSFGSKGAAQFEATGLAQEAVNATGVAGSNRASPGPVRRFLQTPGYVAITMEEGNASGMEQGRYRIIPLDKRPALGSKIRGWMGDSRGRWEGNTLVVETRNIYFDNPIISTYGHAGQYPGTGETLTVTERFTRLDADTLEYRYTINDPGVYVRPYTVVHELSRDDDFKVSPSLCHENNWRNLGGQLATARADEEGALKFAVDSQRQRLERLEELKAQWAATEWNKTSR